jgi:CheY-like chemotaxis protein
LGVINDILDMSKIEANKFELSFDDFNFEKMLRKVANVINFRVEEKQQLFNVHIDKRIPRVLYGDDQRLAQVITNLLSNAVKFTPDYGKITLDARLETIDVASEESAGVAGGAGNAGKTFCTLRISVTDTGIGLSEEQQGRLFKSFEQAESGTARKYGGTGLGLAISKRIVEMMQGAIRVESGEGQGAAFIFTVKLEKGTAVNESLLSPGVNWKNLRILVVDDSKDILDYFMDIGYQLGFSCVTAPSGEEALKVITEQGFFDIYFVDWKMPGMDGIELSHRIREQSDAGQGAAQGREKSVVIMISAAEWSTIEEEARNAGVDKFLSKPLFPSDIVDIVNQCLGETAAQSDDAGEEAALPTDDFDGRWIILAEDVEINREIVLSLLESTRLGIDCAENGLEAVKLFTENPEKYDMIFMDIQMPEMDGYNATRTIRASTAPGAKTIPIIAMTANVFREDIEKCLAAGMNGHVGKPLDLHDVMTQLRAYIQ